MTLFVWVVMFAVALLAAFVQGSIGIGFALIVAPMLGLLAPGLLPVSLLLLMLPLNFLVAWRERKALAVRSSLWITAGRVAGKYRGRPASRSERKGRLQWVGCDRSSRRTADVRLAAAPVGGGCA